MTKACIISPGGRAATIAALLRRFRDDESGATVVEYGLICSLIFLAIVVPLRDLLGDKLQVLFQNIASQMK